jgi:pimeloyl-ACP methyl ester carboxylesterase
MSMKTIILPGLGADSRMYPAPSYERLSDVVFAQWPEYTGETTLEDVAESVIARYKITKDMIVGGASLGGMVAIEIAKIVGIGKVLLIGSATRPSYVNPALEKLSTLAEITPIKLIQILIDKTNLGYYHVAISMFEQSNPDFFRAMCKAIFKWKGRGGYNGAVCQIHGSDDMVIFPPAENVQIVHGGGHVISMSHGHIVAGFIEKNITSS